MFRSKVVSLAVCFVLNFGFSTMAEELTDKGTDVQKSAFSSEPVQQGNKSSKEQDRRWKILKDKLILYFPNRFMDTLDTFSLSLGVGPVIKLQGWLTRWFSFGTGIGSSAKLIKGYNREYGAGMDSGWSASFLCFSSENYRLYRSTRGVIKYFRYKTGVPATDQRVYDIWVGPRDIFALGGEAAAIVEVDAAIHPFELFDFAVGFLLLDPKGDDLTMEAFE